MEVDQLKALGFTCVDFSDPILKYLFKNHLDFENVHISQTKF